MNTGRAHKLTLVQILALIALAGIVLTIVLPRLLDSAGEAPASIEAPE